MKQIHDLIMDDELIFLTEASTTPRLALHNITWIGSLESPQ